MSFPYPTGDPALDLIFLALSLAVGWYGLKAAKWTAVKVKGEAEKAQKPGLPDVPQMWDHINQQGQQIRELQQEAFEQRSQSNRLASDVYHQGERIRELEINEARFIEWTIYIREGIKAGRIPPYPDEPDWLQIFLDSHGGYTGS